MNFNKSKIASVRYRGYRKTLDGRVMTRVVQIFMSDSHYAEQLCRALRSDGGFADCRILCGEGEKEEGEIAETVRVIDLAHLRALPRPLANPVKTVLVASGEVDLEQVWEAGIVSVLFHSESLEYAKLAILAALLRPAKASAFPWKPENDK